MDKKERKNRKYKNLFKSVKKQFNIRLLSEDFETFGSAKTEQKYRIKQLVKSGTAEDKFIAKILKGCRINRRCWNSVCPVCMRWYRIRHCASLLKLCKDRSDARIVHLIPAIYLKRPGELKKLSVRTFHMMVHKQLRDLNLPFLCAIGGSELAMCEKTRMWIPHFHIVVFGLTPDAEKKLRNTYRKQNNEGRISKPFMVQKLKDPVKQISYTLKSFPTRRRNVEEKHLPYKGKVRISEPYHTESLRFFAKHEPQNFEFLYGYTQRGGKVFRIYDKSWKELKF